MTDFSPYAVELTSDNVRWDPTPEYMFLTIRSTEAYFNQQLQRRGNVFLNEIYDALDFPRTTEGCTAGWLSGGSFGIQISIEHIDNGYLKDSYKLDFNVQGHIADKI